jgi:hypothetical protein
VEDIFGHFQLALVQPGGQALKFGEGARLAPGLDFAVEATVTQPQFRQQIVINAHESILVAVAGQGNSKSVFELTLSTAESTVEPSL